MNDRGYRPSTETSVHVWDSEVNVERTQHSGSNRWLKISVGADITVAICFDSDESEAAFFDSVAAADPRASE